MKFIERRTSWVPLNHRKLHTKKQGFKQSFREIFVSWTKLGSIKLGHDAQKNNNEAEGKRQAFSTAQGVRN
jgi:hypothetical protein